MKTALPLLILALSASGLQAQSPIVFAAKKPAGHAKCVQCSHAPCECGHSPSYYTTRPNPARARALAAIAAKARAKVVKAQPVDGRPKVAKPAAKHPPLFTHWSRPQLPPAPAATPMVKPPAATAPVTEDARLEDYLRRLEAYLAYFEGRELIGAAPARKLGFRFKRREPIPTQTLVPSPRRANALPTRNVNQSLGFAPSDSLVNTPRPANPLPGITPKQSLGFEPGLVGRNPFDRSGRGSRPRRDGKPLYSGKPAFSGKPKFSGPPKFAPRPPRGGRR